MAGRGRLGGRGAGGGARRGRGWAGPLGSVMLTSRPAEMGTKGDGATITHETGEGGKERERVRGREKEGRGDGRGEGERGERRGRGREIPCQFYRIQFQSLVLVLSTRAYES